MMLKVGEGPVPSQGFYPECYPGHAGLILQQPFINCPETFDVEFPEGDSLPPYTLAGCRSSKVEDHAGDRPVRQVCRVEDASLRSIGLKKIPSPGRNVLPRGDLGKALIVYPE
jgi:hypothetical protein